MPVKPSQPMETQPAKGLHPGSEIDSVLICPACSAPFGYHKKMHIRGAYAAKLVDLNTDEPLPLDLSERQQDALLDIVAERRIFAAATAMRSLLHNDERAYESCARSKPFPCPSCKAGLQILSQMIILGVECIEDAPLESRPKIGALSDEDQKLWDEWTANGFLQNFFDAGAIDNPSTKFIRDKSQAEQIHFVKNWFRTAVPKDLPSEHRAKMIAEYDSWRIACFSAQGIVAILVDGAIRCLMPRSTIFDYKPKEQLVASGNGQAAIEKAPPVERWIRTRYGYALAGTMFFTALQQESIGAFGRATQSQRQTRSGLPVAADEEEEQ